MEKEKQSASDAGVQYRRAKTSTIALVMLQGASCMCFYSAIGSVSYAANLGFGISVLLVGTLMTLARLFDGITDPIISMLCLVQRNLHQTAEYFHHSRHNAA